jgi:MATE family multidrug resistance protein
MSADASTTSLDPAAPQDRLPAQLYQIARLACPTIAQMAAYTVMEFINTLMLSRLGSREPTAAVNAGILTYALVSLGIGTVLLVNTLVSQSFGRGNRSECGRYLWQGVWFSVFYALLLVPVGLGAGAVFRWFGHEPALVAMESVYMRVCLGGAILQILVTTMGQFLLATDRPFPVFVAAVAGVCVNILAGYTLIFGHFGLPAMGVAGAAWGRNAGVGVEVLGLAVVALGPVSVRQFGALSVRLRLREMAELLRLGLPTGVQQMADVMAWSLFANLVIAHFGTDAMAANSFVFRAFLVSFMPAVGLGAAVTALVGRSIGARDLPLASRYGHLGFFVGCIYMLACGVGFLIWRQQVIGLFTSDREIILIGARLMVFAAAFQLFDAMCIIYSSALRGAGDTLVPGVATAVLNWAVTIGGGLWVARHFPQWGPNGPWLAGLVFIASLGLFLCLRFVGGNWKSIHLQTPGSGQAAIGGAAMLAPLESAGIAR